MTILSALVLGVSLAQAGCSTDLECKGARVCEQGRCVDPGLGPAPGAEVDPVPRRALDAGQRLAIDHARSRARTGTVLGAVMAVTGLGTLVTNNGDAEALPRLFGGTTLALGAIAVPVAASGGAEARRVGQQVGLELGSQAVRSISWVGYGLSMGLGGVMLAYGVSGAYIDNGLIASTTVLGFTCTLAMAFDARSAAAELEAFAAQDLAGGSPARPRVAWSLGFAPARDGGTFTLAGRFP